MNGKLLVIEGLDGSGKATQTGRLFTELQTRGDDVMRVSFPDYDSDSSALVKMYLGGEFGSDPNDVNPYAASSFYAVDRFASYAKNWKDFYLGGGIVIADRYTTSNAIHQCAKLPEEKWDEFLHWLFDYEYRLMGIPVPEKVIYLRVDPSVSQELMDKRYSENGGKKDIHEADVEYLRRARTAADHCAKKLGIKLYIYDENSYPSGFAGGHVSGIVPEGIAAYARIRIAETPEGVRQSGDCVGVYAATDNGNGLKDAVSLAGIPESEWKDYGNRFIAVHTEKQGSTGWMAGFAYVDLMRPEVHDAFMETTHEQYFKRFGEDFRDAVPAIFTDEPSVGTVGRDALPFSFWFAHEFQKKNGYDLKKNLPLLFGVPLFIMCGFPHCVADAFYYLCVPLDFYAIFWPQILIFYISIVLGNFVGCNLYRIICYHIWKEQQ